MQVYSNKNAMYVCTFFVCFNFLSNEIDAISHWPISNGEHLPNEEGVCDAFVKLAASQ